MKLYLVRHGEAVSSTVDPDQPLSPKGIEETNQVARQLASMGVELDEIMHSVKTRARQTAEIIRDHVAPDLTLIEKEGMKPNDPIEPLIEEIKLFDRAVMLVGHLPFMERLLARLLFKDERPSPVSFCGSCAVTLQGGADTWEQLSVITPGLNR